MQSREQTKASRNRRSAALARLRAPASHPRTLLLILLLGLAPCAARAHVGPPFPIIVDEQVGPHILNVWADPDVGIGTFYIVLEPPPGGTLPEDPTVEVRVQPVTGRLPETAHPAERQPTRKRVQYEAKVPFDAEERWRVRVLLDSAHGGGEAAAEVDVTPPGLGAITLVLCLFPFVAVGFLWFRAVRHRRGTSAAPRGRTRRGRADKEPRSG